MSARLARTDIWTPANKVTFARILLIPIFIAVLLAPWPSYFPESFDMATLKPWLAAAVFILISATDALDGYLARSRNEVTDFGKFVDPLADKLLVTAALLSLIELGVLPTWVVLTIVAREFIVSGVRMIAASRGEVIAASWYGKIKTVLQMVAIVLFIVKDSHVIVDFDAALADWLYILSWFVMLAALVFTVVSMCDYLYKARYLLGFGAAEARAETKEAGLEAGTVDLAALASLSCEVLDAAKERKLFIATAESCTGGLIAAALTSIAGSSECVDGGVISYSNKVKQQVLHVEEEILRAFGAVSEQTARQMAEGVLALTGADLSVSVTGIAGPGGGTPEKPVGTVWIGLATKKGSAASVHAFSGDRSSVRMKTAYAALQALKTTLESWS